MESYIQQRINDDTLRFFLDLRSGCGHDWSDNVPDNTDTYYNNPPYSRSGMQFNGVNHYMEFLDNDNFSFVDGDGNYTDFTIFYTYRLDKLPQEGTFQNQYVWNKNPDSQTNSANEWSVYIDTNPRPHHRIYDPDNSGYRSKQKTGHPTATQNFRGMFTGPAGATLATSMKGFYNETSLTTNSSSGTFVQPRNTNTKLGVARWGTAGATYGKLTFKSGLLFREYIPNVQDFRKIFSEIENLRWPTKTWSKPMIGGSRAYFKSETGAFVSTSNETSGFLSNTPFTVTSGTFKVSIDSHNGNFVKVIECVSAGDLELSVDISGGSTWSLWIDTGGGYSNSDGSGIISSQTFTLSTGDKIILGSLTGDYAILRT